MAQPAVPAFAIITPDQLENGRHLSIPASSSYTSGGTEYRLVSASLLEVTYRGDKLITIAADPGDEPYPGPPHWRDNNGNGKIEPENGDRSLPVGYPRNTYVTVEAKFEGKWNSVSGSPSPEFDEKYFAGGKSLSTHLEFPKMPLIRSGSYLTYRDVQSINKLEDWVYYHGSGDIQWTVYNDNVGSSFSAGQSVNELYATLNTPKTSDPETY